MGEDSEAFAAGYADVTTGYETEIDQIQQRGRAAAANDPKQVAAVFDELRGATQRTHDRYEALNPPASLQEPHASLLDNLRRQSEALERVADGTRSEAPEAAALQELAALLGEFAATQQLLAQRLAEDG